MDALFQDIAQAFRSLWRSPRFAWAAVVTLALGIGAATTAFTFLNWVLLRPLQGIRTPSQLGIVWFAARPASGGFNPNGLNTTQHDFALQASPAVAALGAYESSEPLYVGVDAEIPSRAGTAFVTGEFLQALGTRTERGRVIAPDDNAPHAARAVAMISDEFWRTRLGSRPDVIGRTLRVNGLPVVVIGVTERGFRGIDRMEPTDLWLPGELYWEVKHVRPSERPAELTYFHDVVRLRAGASFTDAERQLADAVKRLAAADTSDFFPNVTATIFPGLGLPAMERESLGHQLALMMAIAGLMLLVACANAANLFLVHRTRRHGETAIRMVLGVPRGRLFRLHLIESVLVGLAGATAGVLIAAWLLDFVRGLPLVGFVPLDNVSLDWRVFAFAAASGAVAALAAGTLPTLLGAQEELGTPLREAGPTVTHGTPILRGALASAQIAIAIALVTGAWLFARTLRNLNDVPLGFDPAGVTMFLSDPASQGYPAERVRAYQRALIAGVRSEPGVERAAFVSIPPFTGMSMQAAIRLPGASATAPPVLATVQEISHDYLPTLGIPLLRGRGFEADDDAQDTSTTPERAIISATLARRLFGNTDPIGRTFSTFRKAVQVIGEAADIRYGSRSGEVQAILYRSLARALDDTPTLMVRSQLAPRVVEREVASAAAAVDPMIPIENKGLLERQIESSLGGRAILFRLLGILSLLTLALAAVGIYTLVAYGVASRTREFGIRIALGAGAREILRTATFGALMITGTGVIGGILVTLYVTRFIAALLYGVSPLNSLAIGGAALVLTAAAFLASWIPARRATKVDPMVALRAE